MTNRNIILFFLICVFYFTSLDAWACTTFNLQGPGVNLFGKNYDWPCENGMVVINKRGIKKVAMQATTNKAHLKGKPAQWISKYGSVTFNQYGRELPQGGINEAGLVVEAMALESTVYPEPDSRPFIHRSQWKQYQLDNHKTVDEVIESDSKIRIFPTHKSGIGAHFLITDQTGKCAVIEFLKGKRVVYTGSQLPVRALANDPYAASLSLWKHSKGISYNNRFVLAANDVRQFKHKTLALSVDKAFSILDKVSQGNYTKWRIVYDILNLKIVFQTQSNPGIRALDMNKIDFSCKTPVQVLDINSVKAGDVIDKFGIYSYQKNRELIFTSFKQTYQNVFHSDRFQNLMEQISRYPDTTGCR